MQSTIISNLLNDYIRGIPLHKSSLTAELLQQYDYFEYQRDAKNVLKQICSKVECHYQPKNSFLFHKNYFSDYLFIMLEGEALKLEEKDEYDIAKEYKLLNDQKEIQNQIRLMQSKQQDVSKLKKENADLRMEIHQLSTRNEDIDKLVFDNCGQTYKGLYCNSLIDPDINLFKITQKIIIGNLFGQISCVEPFDQRRSYSIFVNEESRFLSIKLSHIQQILSEKIKIRTFIHEYFNCSESELQTLADSRQFNQYFEEKTFQENQTVINQNEKDDNSFYLVFEGKFSYSFSFKDYPGAEFSLQDKHLMDISTGDLFGHEKQTENHQNNSPFQNSSQKLQKLRPFSVICKEDKSKVIKIQSILLQYKISKQIYASILDSGNELYKKLMEDTGYSPALQNSSSPINNFTQIKQIVKKHQDTTAYQVKPPKEYQPPKLQSECSSPQKNPESPTKKSLIKSRIVFKNLKQDNSKSQRQSPIIIRESPKIEIKQRIVFNLSKEAAFNKFRHPLNFEKVKKIISEKLDNQPTNSQNYSCNSSSQLRNSNPEINNLHQSREQNIPQFKKARRYKLNLDSNSSQPSPQSENNQSGFTEALDTYVKSNKCLKRESSIFAKFEKPLFSSSTSSQSTYISQSAPQLMRSNSMAQIPSSIATSFEQQQEEKIEKDTPLISSIQVQHNLKKRLNTHTFKSQNSLQIFTAQPKHHKKIHVKQQSSYDFQVDGRNIKHLLSTLSNNFYPLEYTEKSKLLNAAAISSVPDSPLTKLYTSQSKPGKRPSLVLDLKMLRQPIKTQELNS